MSMNTVPNEIASAIFHYACTDGGKTARSLQLVSRRVSAVARIHRFRTIAVRGIQAITSVVNALTSDPAESHTIEHLFVSDTPAHVQSDVANNGNSDAGTGGPPLRDLVKYLINHASCSLRSYTMVMDNRSRQAWRSRLDPILTAAAERTALPNLTSLTLCDSAGGVGVPFALGVLGAFTWPALQNLTVGFPSHAIVGMRLTLSGWLSTEPPVKRIVLYHTSVDVLGISAVYDLVSSALSNIGLPGSIQYDLRPVIGRDITGRRPEPQATVEMEAFTRRLMDADTVKIYPVLHAERSEEDWLHDWQASADAVAQRQDFERYHQ
jgi:hypothetical protein